MTETPETVAAVSAPSRWRARNAVVEARQLADDLRNHTEVAAWIEANGGHAEIPFAEPCLYVETPQGRMRAGIGDWIIKGVTGLFFIKADAEFREGYEPEAPALGAAEATPAALAADFDRIAAWMETRPNGVTWTGDGLDGTVAGLRDAAKSIRDNLVPAWEARATELRELAADRARVGAELTYARAELGALRELHSHPLVAHAIATARAEDAAMEARDDY